MSTKIAINGFGRIGRYLTRLIATEDTGLDLVAINARASNEDLVHLFKYDSVHGTFTGTVVANEQGFLLNGKQVIVTRDDIGKWQWKKLGCSLIVETTGKFTDRKSAEKHLECGAEKVIISAPAKNADATIVYNVNNNDLSADDKIISSASCTTNCLAPCLRILQDNFGIRYGTMTTVHSYTMSQRILDGSHKDRRRGRACAINMVPTTTGAAKAVSLVIPELADKLDGMAIRVDRKSVV